MSVISRFKAFDVYKKLPQDLTEPTTSGAIITIASTLVMILLFLSEFREFLKIQEVTEMFIDTNRGGAKLTVNIDLLLPGVICDVVSLDAQDIMGTHHLNLGGTLYKKRIKDGKAFDTIKHEDGSTHFDLERASKALKDGESCQLYGSIQVNKVPGNFHISTHAYNLHEFAMKNNYHFLNMSYVINHISFGEDTDFKIIKSQFDQGVLNPLDGKKKIQTDAHPQSYTHYISVVPTTYADLKKNEYYVHQFTSTFKQTPLAPSVASSIYFRYDMSPVTVKFSQRKETFFKFLVQLCGIIGGVFAVSGIIDSVVHKSVVKILKKANMGKLS